MPKIQISPLSGLASSLHRALPVLVTCLIAGLLVGLSWSTPSQAAKEEPSKLLDKPAPILSGRALISRGLLNLKKLRQDVVFLKDDQGKPIKENGKYKTETTQYAQVLNFFATYCVPCVKEIPTFNKIAEKYQGEKVRFLYVNVDVERTQEEVKAFAKAKGISVEMMFPSVRYAMKAYDIDALPRIVIIDPDGVIRTVIRGFHEDLGVQMDEVLAGVLPKG